MPVKVEKLKPTPLTETNPNIISWKRPRVLVVGNELTADVKTMFMKYGYIVRAGWFNEVFDDIDFLCFTGGGDLHPRLYGQDMHPQTHPSPERDNREVEIFHQYPGIPKVGICRGLQLINVLHGGQMTQHVEGHENGKHEIEDVWGRKLQTSSVHHQMVIPPPKENATVLAWSKGIAYHNNYPEPEAVWYPETSSLGVQGHPEWGPDEYTKYFMILVKEFVLPMTSYKSRGADVALHEQDKIIH